MNIDTFSLAKKLTNEVEENLQELDWYLGRGRYDQSLSRCLETMGKAIQNTNMALRLILEQGGPSGQRQTEENKD